MSRLSPVLIAAMLAGCNLNEAPSPGDLEDELWVSAPIDTAAPLDTELEAVDTGTYGHLGLEIRTYLLPDGPHTPDGSVPRFLLMRPTEPPAESVPTLLWLHGGVGAPDDDPDFGELCTLAGIESMANATLESRLLAERVAERGSAVLVPVSPWCDLWTGLGPADPVDTNHASLLHVRQVTRRLLAGVDGVRLDPDALSIWGVSLGGVGAFSVSADLCSRGLCPQSVVSDSGPWDLISLYDHPNGSMPQDWLDHFFGGPPFDEDGAATQWLDNYQRVDAPSLLASGLRVRTMLTYNREDLLTDEFHGPAVVSALADSIDDGLYYTTWDANHRAPGTHYHTQSNLRSPPLVSAMEAALRFQFGERVRFFEAEDLDLLTGTPMEATDSELSSAAQSCSGEVAIARTVDEEPGVVLDAELPSSLVRETPLELVMQWVLLSTSAAGEEDVLLTLTFTDEAGEVLHVHEVLGEQARSARTPEYASEHVEGATVTLTDGLPAGPVRLQITSELASTVLVDGFWAAWPEPSP